MRDDQLPEKSARPQGSKIVEGEVVESGFSRGGFYFEEKPVPFWKRGLRRIALGAVLIVLGLAAGVVGIVLTLSLVGAFIGIPLIFAGALFVIFGLIVILGGGQMRVMT